MPKSTNLHCVLIDCRERLVYEEDIESGTRPSEGLNPVVKQRASGVFLKIFLISKYCIWV